MIRRVDVDKEKTMKKLFGKKSQGNKSDNRKMKTWEEKVADHARATKKKAHEATSAVGNVASNLLSATVAVTAGVVVSDVAEDMINNVIVGSVAIADDIYYKTTGTGTVDVKRLIGWKTMSDSAYIEAIRRGKKFKDVRPNHWCNQHASEINKGASVAGKVGGVLAGVKTTTSIYNGIKMVDSWASEEIDCVTAESAKADEQHV